MEDKLVKSVELAGNIQQVDVSIISLISNADFVVKFVIAILILSSFWCWAIIFDKIMKMKKIKEKTTKFEKVFWSGQLLEQLYDRVKSHADHGISMVFVAAMYEWSNIKKAQSTTSDYFLKLGFKERIYQAMNVVRLREIEKIESNLVFLATVGSSAPFIGLFGTVWGIMHSFQSIAASKNTTLAVVAPGIAEALLATAIGLFAAIPAVIFYNFIAKEVNNYNYKLEDFSAELGSLLSREIDEAK